MNINWAEIWHLDTKAMLSTMLENMAADLRAGYDPEGASITRQLSDIFAYKTARAAEASKLAAMTPADANKWCYRDLKRRGVIA